MSENLSLKSLNLEKIFNIVQNKHISILKNLRSCNLLIFLYVSAINNFTTAATFVR